MKSKFAAELERLNASQKSAVLQTDGPLMVVAGPGTGKTQLLAMRVANILQTTDTDAGSILCLTFTESASANMVHRMTSIFGAEAYRVAVNTFHGLGSDIISRYGQYFYSGAIFRPAGDLKTIKIIEDILEKLPHDNPLSSKMNGQFVYLNSLISTISDLKKAGLLPSEVKELLEQNLDFCRQITPLVSKTFTDRISKKTLPTASEMLREAERIAAETTKKPFTNEPPLAKIFADSLRIALDEVEISDKTTPLSNWKKQFVATDDAKKIILKDEQRSIKLVAVSDVYDEYLREMLEQNFYDYDDMILRVVHALEIFPSLKAELQERYQYIMVDEFQDTNDAQMRLLRALTDYDGQPNIMVVGDDDQAIFRFQGADISNIQLFNDTYPEAKTIVLSENYRSNRGVLNLSSQVSSQIAVRLTHILNISKDLSHNVDRDGRLKLMTSSTIEQEFDTVAEQIANEIKAGGNPAGIAVIARRHADLEKLLPFLAQRDIAVEYERRQNILSSEPVQILELLARVVLGIAYRDDNLVDSLLPELISHPAWQIEPRDLWQIGLSANRQRKFWLEIMLEYPGKTCEIAEWLIVMGAVARVNPLEFVLDRLTGNESSDDDFTSPIYQHFFNPEKLRLDPNAYLKYLSDLTTLRQVIRDYRNDDEQLKLDDFIEIIDSYRSLGRQITSVQKISSCTKCVQLLTAHKAKGLEFDSVYIVNASSQNWGQKSRGRSSLVPLPTNMPFAVVGDSSDEQLRLLFVALTRAKYNLTVSWHSQSESGKELLPLEYLADSHNLEDETLPENSVRTAEQQLLTAWHGALTNTSDDSTRAELTEILAETLANYRLSATHLNTFLDVTSGGPADFLLRDLLQFPSMRSASESFGTAIHTTLQRAHTHLTAREHAQPLEDMLNDFETTLREAPLSETDFNFYLKKGIDALKIFYEKRIDSFRVSQIAEYSFRGENVFVNDARLTGMIDLIDIDRQNKTIVITDYKTGKAASSWSGHGDQEKIKLLKYRRQLLFYKLLVENSREFRNYTVEKGILEFVEPVGGEITRLELDYDPAEEAQFVKLIGAVWQRIITLDLPDMTTFSGDMHGIMDFEQFLLGDAPRQ